MSLQEILKYHNDHQDLAPSFIHMGFTDPKTLSQELGQPNKDQKHIFVERFCGRLYQKHFKGAHRVLLKDGFVRRKRNSDYPHVEFFSDLHATFGEEGRMDWRFLDRWR